MDNQKLMKSFRQALALASRHDQQANQGLIENFQAAYADADSAGKSALVREFADDIVRTAHGQPSNIYLAKSLGASVELRCRALAATVDDKSLIPADFHSRLITAALKLKNQMTRDVCLLAELRDAAGSIISEARRFDIKTQTAAPARPNSP